VLGEPLLGEHLWLNNELSAEINDFVFAEKPFAKNLLPRKLWSRKCLECAL
jgi:hypothetical protein